MRKVVILFLFITIQIHYIGEQLNFESEFQEQKLNFESEFQEQKMMY